MEEEKNTENPNFNQWIKDNLRIIISVLIVVAIAGGIYSYSKRTQPPGSQESQLSMEEQGLETAEGPSATEGESQKVAENQQKTPATGEQARKAVTAAQTGESKETEGSFIETAGRGDGVTHLARRALANYLEKSPDSALTPEHKIYIEDYLRKHAGFKGRVFVGTSVDFNKDLIKQAVDQSKKLNDAQLRNLHKYAVMVPSLT